MEEFRISRKTKVLEAETETAVPWRHLFALSLQAVSAVILHRLLPLTKVRFWPLIAQFPVRTLYSHSQNPFCLHTLATMIVFNSGVHQVTLSQGLFECFPVAFRIKFKSLSSPSGPPCSGNYLLLPVSCPTHSLPPSSRINPKLIVLFCIFAQDFHSPRCVLSLHLLTSWPYT